ncbi:MAG: leucyl aminopeptidase [Candidatus Parcubacteria bacterium]|nr:MAG: leucyl aminopeptidase [Candidatus Parcubacteria bacterium]
MKVDKYKIDFYFDLKEQKFWGREQLLLKLNKKVNQLILDSQELIIDNLKVNNKESKWRLLKDKLIINQNFLTGNNIVEINFYGYLKEGLGGIYLSKYYNDQKRLNYLITTQLEPIEARKVFPCVDHPSFKSIFEISVNIDKNLKAISNTLPKEEKIVNNRKIIFFKPSPLMSTYLFYLGIGEWHFIKEKYRNILLRLATLNKDNLKGGYFALKNAKKFLGYLENYFNYHYPLEKLDLLAIPDFAAGAMENWGAITFRENLLLSFEGITSDLNKERILEVIAHELVHMWFGNLVTMKWWDDLWLNESFATYLAYKVVDYFYPQWRLKERYVLEEVISALAADGLINSHPIKVKVNKPEESIEIFDEISYEKGGSVLRMIENYLGEEKFRQGLRNYIRKFAYQNANHKDFLNTFDQIKKEKISKIIEGFIHQVNFPIVRVKTLGKKYILFQEKFTFLPTKKQTRWQIPTIIEIKSKEKKLIIKKKKQETKSLFLLNKKFGSFFLVDYENDILIEILKQKEKLTELDIVFLLRSFDFLIRKGEKTIFDFLNFLNEFFDQEKSEIILSEIISILNFYYLLLTEKRIANFLEKFSLKVINLLGKEPTGNEPPLIISLRNKALISLGLIGNQEILNFSLLKFKKSFPNLNPEIKQAIFNNVVLTSNIFFDRLLKYYFQTKIIEEQNKCLIALGQTKNKQKIKKLLDLTITEKIRFNQVIFIFSSLAFNRNFSKLIFNWLEKNWSKLEKRGGGAGKSDFVLIRILKSTIPFVGSFVDKQKLIKFLNRSELKRFIKTRKIIIEKIRINKKILKNFYGRINYF